MDQKLLECARGQLESLARLIHKRIQGLIRLVRVEHLDEVSDLLLRAIIKLYEIIHAALEGSVQLFEVVRRDEDYHVIFQPRDAVEYVEKSTERQLIRVVVRLSFRKETINILNHKEGLFCEFVKGSTHVIV